MEIFLVLYFFAGLLQDFLATLNVRFIANEHVILASLTSFLTTVVTMLVLYNILSNLDEERSIVAIIVYSAGIALGTIVGMAAKIKNKKISIKI